MGHRHPVAGRGHLVRLLLSRPVGFENLRGRAGVFPLGPQTSDLHIGAIATAFVLSVLGMYLAPSTALVPIAPRITSWPLAAGVALAVVLGHSVLPMGIGQRLAASCLLAWLASVAVRALRVRRR